MTRNPARTRMSVLCAILAVIAFASLATATDIGAQPPERDDIAELRLACRPDNVGGERGVLCRWSESTVAHTRGYVVYRIVDGEPREAIHRVGVDGRRAFFDTEIRPGSTHVYGVVAVNRMGEAVAVGGPERVRWPEGGRA